MDKNDLFALMLFGSFGAWWFIAPRSVLRFYAWFHSKPELATKNPIQVRIAGLVWMVLLVGVMLWQPRNRPNFFPK